MKTLLGLKGFNAVTLKKENWPLTFKFQPDSSAHLNKANKVCHFQPESSAHLDKQSKQGLSL